MPVIHVAVPVWAVKDPNVAAHWLPFVDKIAKRSKSSVIEIVHRVEIGELQLHLAWDMEAQQAIALAITRIFLRGGKKVCGYCYHWGPQVQRWAHLLPEMEKYHKELGCSAISIESPRYWIDRLKEQGYRHTHTIMEKDL